MSDSFQQYIAGLPILNLEYQGKSKAGGTTYLGWIGQQKVKIYQAHNPAHAMFIKTVSEHPDLADCFPQILSIEDTYILAEWVSGYPLDNVPTRNYKNILKKIAKMQASIHANHCDIDANTVGFDYIKFLEERLYQYCKNRPMTGGIYKILDTVKKEAPFTSSKFSHPDITPKNLVQDDKTTFLKIVDNELLTQSPYYLIDLFNTCYSLGNSPKLIRYYIDQYLKHVDDLQLQDGWDSFLIALWGLRLVGSYFQAGKFEYAYQLADSITKDRDYSDNHLIIQSIRNRLA